jgi:hypothetical protein
MASPNQPKQQETKQQAERPSSGFSLTPEQKNREQAASIKDMHPHPRHKLSRFRWALVSRAEADPSLERADLVREALALDRAGDGPAKAMAMDAGVLEVGLVAMD